MKKEEYINSVIKQIKNSRAKALIQNELADHIEDRIEFYTDSGYSYDEACKKALERMGSPEQTAIQMDKLYSTKFNTALAVLISLCYAFTVFVLPFGPITLLSWNMGVDNFLIIKEIFIIVSIIIALFIARRRYWKNLALFQLVYFGVYLIPVFFANGIKIVSPFVLLVNCIFSGNIGDFNTITSSYCHMYFSSFVVAQSVLFYLILIAFIIYNYIFINREVKNGVSINAKKHKTASVIISALFVACVIFLGAVSDFGTYQTYDSIIIYESDEKADMDDVPVENRTVLDVSYDLAPYPYISCFNADSTHITNDMELLKENPDYPQDEYVITDETVNFNKFADYKRQTTSFKYICNKKYIKVVMTTDYDDNEKIKETPWTEAENFEYKDTIQYGGIPSDYFSFSVVRQQ